MILETIHDPRDIKTLNDSQTQLLCTELREFLLKNVSKTGGHLASNLGAVELTVAIHRVFDTSRDRLVFDVGHQCYTHKILTGRREQFSSLRQYGGLSGFPKPRESGHDAFIAGHASNSVSVALGMARARTLQHQDYSVLALIGDGALSGGLAYEGLNNAGSSGEPLIVILNDNGMSIDGNVGAVSEHLGLLRSKPAYYEFKKAYRDLLDRNAVGRAVYDFNHHLKTNVKKALLPNSTMFEDMGFTYLGPVNGHDVGQLTNTLKWAKDLNCPVLVHVHTKKGKGYPPPSASRSAITVSANLTRGWACRASISEIFPRCSATNSVSSQKMTKRSALSPPQCATVQACTIFPSSIPCAFLTSASPRDMPWRWPRAWPSRGSHRS